MKFNIAHRCLWVLNITLKCLIPGKIKFIGTYALMNHINMRPSKKPLKAWVCHKYKEIGKNSIFFTSFE